MKRCLGILLAVVACHGPASAQCRLTTADSPNGRIFRLENDQLLVEVLTRSARIHSLRLKENGKEFLEPVREETVQHSRLLPVQWISNHGGFSDWFWTERPPQPSEFSVEGTTESAEAVTLRLTGQAGQWKVNREIRLAQGSRALEVTVTITNAAETPRELSYWAHIVPNPEFFATEGARLVLPAKAGGHSIRGHTTHAFAQEGIQTLPATKGDSFFAIAQPWAAMLSGEEILLVKSGAPTLDPDGFFYRWQGDQGDGTVTLEIIHPTRKLQPSESATYPITLELPTTPNALPHFQPTQPTQP